MAAKKTPAWIFDTESDLLAATGVRQGELALAQDTGRIYYSVDPSIPSWSQPQAAPDSVQGLRTVLDINFSSLPNQDFLAAGDGPVSFNGQEWDVAGTALASQFEIVNGTGLVLDKTVSAGAGLGPYFSLPRYLASGGPADQVPGWRIARRWRMSIRFSVAVGGVARLGLYGGPASAPISSGRRVGSSMDTSGAAFLLDGVSPSFAGPFPTIANANVHVIELFSPWDYWLDVGEWTGPAGTIQSGADGMPQISRREQANLVAPLLVDDDASLPASVRADAQAYRLALGISDGNGTLTIERIRVESE